MQAFKILLLFLTLPHFAFCGDFSEWWYDTPGGNILAYESWGDGDRVMLHCRDVLIQKGKGQYDDPILDYIERWYFYQNHVVGIYWKNDVRGYFIFNETDCSCQTFDNIQAFDERRAAHHAKPTFWTRWYDDSDMDAYRFLPDFSGLFFLLFLLGILAILAVLYIIQLIKTRFSLKNRVNQLSLSFFCLIAFAFWLRCWLHDHPQSF